MANVPCQLLHVPENGGDSSRTPDKPDLCKAVLAGGSHLPILAYETQAGFSLELFLSFLYFPLLEVLSREC